MRTTGSPDYCATPIKSIFFPILRTVFDSVNPSGCPKYCSYKFLFLFLAVSDYDLDSDELLLRQSIIINTTGKDSQQQKRGFVFVSK